MILYFQIFPVSWLWWEPLFFGFFLPPFYKHFSISSGGFFFFGFDPLEIPPCNSILTILCIGGESTL